MRHGADIRAPKIWTPHTYQTSAVQFLHERTSLNPEGRGGAALFLDPGLGKSSISLEWVKQMKDFGLANRFLVVAPLRVVYQVWPYEIAGWQNFRGISYSIAHGSPEKRRKALAMQTNLHIINRDAMVWLAKQCEGRKHLPWQGIIIDESTSFKTWSSARSKAVRKLISRIPYRVILTGTPAPKNLADLFPQVWLLDEGKALGDNITRFREKYCIQVGQREQNNFVVRSETSDTVHNDIAHLALRLDAKDYLSIPEVTHNRVYCELPSKARAEYEDMEKQMFVALANGDGREAVNAGAKYNYCRQISNGGIYDQQHQSHELHDAKTEAIQELIESLQGKPLLIAYQFGHDLERLRKAIPGLQFIKGGMKESDVSRIVDQWNDGTLKGTHLAVQPQALSYGINMQHGPGRDIAWYGPTDSLDIFIQFNARIHRQGVGSAVTIHELCCRDTIDEIVWARLDDMDDAQTKLLDVLRDYARQKLGKK